MDFLRRLFSPAPEPQTVSLGLSSKTKDDSQTMMVFGATAAKYQAAAVTEQAAQKTYDALYKVVLMGESGAGKSSLLKRFTNNSFSNAYCSTIGVDFACKTLAFDGTVVKLQVWDTSGQERFRSITSSYYRGASCVMMIYSCECVDSFRGLARWLDEVRRYCSPEVAVMVVACKSDLSALVDEAEARQWASDNGCLFSVTSAKLNHGVFEAFESLARATSQGRLSGSAVPSLDKAVAANAVDQTNVLRVELSQLQSALQLVTGEPLRCGGCGAMFNWLSQAVAIAAGAAVVGDKKLKAVELAPPLHPSFQSLCPRASIAAPAGNDNNNNANGGGMIWECEFCCRANRLDASEAELSEFRRGATMDFLVRPAEQQEAGAEEGGAVSIFVIDCSGSMAMSEQVAGNLVPARVREKRRAEFAGLLQQGDHNGGGAAAMHLSRLELLQAAVEQAVHALYAKDPKARVGLVAFASDVRLLGGAEGEVTVAGDRLSSFEALNQIRWAPTARPKEAVLADLFALSEGGQTALGPAVQLAVNSCPFGGSVTVCTDGLANVGVARLDEPALLEESRQQIIELGEQCRLRGATVSLYALGEDAAGLALLGTVAEHSGGKVVRLRPAELARQLPGSGAPAVASAVLTMALLHRGLHFRGEADDELERRQWLVKDCGVVHAGGQPATFGFAFRARGEFDLSGLSQLPFQTQMLFTRGDGSVAVRVVTAALPLSDAGAMDAAAVAKGAAEQVAGLCKQGKAEEARRHVVSVQATLAGTTHAKAFAGVRALLERGESLASDEMAESLSRLRNTSFASAKAQ